AGFQQGWQTMTEQWAKQGADAIWLTYSANYLVRTGDIRWAIDPMRITKRVPEAGAVSYDSFKNASFIVMTHNHGDHVDVDLLGELAQMQHLKWVVPEHMLGTIEKIGVKEKYIKLAQPLEPISIDKLRIT